MRIPTGVQVSLGLDNTGTATTNPSNMVWYKLTDHNRNPIGITYSLIEQTDRMANGTLRKYVVAQKFIITADWSNLPTLDSNLVDYTTSGSVYGAAWIKAFYEINAFQPVYVKLIFAQENVNVASATSIKTPITAPAVPTSSTYVDSTGTSLSNFDGVYNAYMTTFTYDILKRRVGSTTNANGLANSATGYDLVNLKIEFTEI
jgi:hypothetical protein